MSDGWSRLRIAVEHGNLVDVRAFLAAGDDVNEPCGSAGLTLLQHSIDAEADTSAQNDLPLSVEMTRTLLDAGADPLARSDRGEAALDLARTYGHVLAVQLLTERLAADRFPSE